MLICSRGCCCCCRTRDSGGVSAPLHDVCGRVAEIQAIFHRRQLMGNARRSSSFPGNPAGRDDVIRHGSVALPLKSAEHLKHDLRDSARPQNAKSCEGT
jgi:hypothetical protein